MKNTKSRRGGLATLPGKPGKPSLACQIFIGLACLAARVAIVQQMMRGMSLRSTHILQHDVLAESGIFYIDPPENMY